jgi:uncharacterized protein (DUF885 family)
MYRAYAGGVTDPRAAADHLYALIDAEQEARETDTPKGHLPDVRPEAQEARAGRWTETLDRLGTIDREDLAGEQQVDADVFAYQLRTDLDRVRLREYERPVNSDSAFWRNLLHEADSADLEEEDDRENYLSLLADIPGHARAQIANMRAGVRRGIGPAQVTMTGREEPVRAVARAASAAETPFLRPLATLPANLPAGRRTEVAERTTRVIEDQVIPAYQELITFLEQEYLPQLPIAIGVSEQPGGEEFYAAQLREFTTTDLTGQEIFDRGMTEVAAIREEMEEVGFPGDLPGLFAFLRTDPQFYATTPRQLLAEASLTCKKVDGVIGRFIGRLPEKRFTVVPTPKEIEAFDTFGRGSAGAYFVNTYDLSSRPLYSLPSLTLHESSPGHSLQLALAEELDLRDFRRRYISAFGEGWGLYCERLGEEMGIYETPYERLGMLSFQMWRAVRLVVDPGMHAFGWTRERAQDFLRENTAIAEHEITTEIDRYISWPGQAASYYLGMLTIQDLRREAEQARGEQFSVRDFHDLVLGLTSVPLQVLASEVRRFIARPTTAGPAAPGR